jgi:hypothetical protein
MLCSSGLIGCDYKMMRMREIGVPTSPYIAREVGLEVGSGRSTSRVRLGVLYMEPVMYSILSWYSFTKILVLHATRCRAAQAR